MRNEDSCTVTARLYVRVGRTCWMFKVSSLAIYSIGDDGDLPSPTVEYILTISINQYIQRLQLGRILMQYMHIIIMWFVIGKPFFIWGSKKYLIIAIYQISIFKNI